MRLGDFPFLDFFRSTSSVAPVRLKEVSPWPPRSKWRRFLCEFGLHRLRLDREEVNGVWWAFCVDCGARYEQLYDMSYGHTYFRRR